MKKLRSIYVNVRLDVEADESLTNEEIVSELDYNFSSFDNEVQVVDTEICDIDE